MTERQVAIDLVTHRPHDDSWVLVLVEQGRWNSERTADELRRLQNRLYDCVDAVVEGFLGARYPESRGRTVVLRLDCYDTPDEPVRKFFDRFAEHIHSDMSVQRRLRTDGWAKELRFEFNWRTFEETGATGDGLTA